MFKTLAATAVCLAILTAPTNGTARVTGPNAGPRHYSVIETGPGNEYFADLLVCRSTVPWVRMECLGNIGNRGALALTRVYRHLLGVYGDVPATPGDVWPPHAKSYGAQVCWEGSVTEDGRGIAACEVPARDWAPELAADYVTAMRAIRSAFRRAYGR